MTPLDHNTALTAAAASPGMRRVLWAEGVSNFGSLLSRMVIPLLAALVLQATPAHMAALLVADILAGAVGSLLLGPWVDRSGKRAVMLLADGLRLALMALLALAVWQGWVGFALLVLVAAANGLLGMAFELARSAWMAQTVPLADLPRRNAQLSMAGSITETAAFALGGWLFQAAGAGIAMAIDALTYAVSALCLRGVQEVVPVAKLQAQAQPRTLGQRLRGLLAESADGLRAVASRPALRALLGIEVMGCLAYALTGTVYTLFVTRDLTLPTSVVGVVAATGGLGAVLGASLAPRWGRRLGPGRTMALGMAAYTVGAACIPLAGLFGTAVLGGAVAWGAVAWLVAHQVIGDAGHTLHDVHDRTLRQTAVPPELLARTDAGLRAAGQLALLAGALLGGVVGTWAGSRAVLWLAVVCAAGAALCAAVKLAERQAPAHPSTP
jgi:MFS family permease